MSTSPLPPGTIVPYNPRVESPAEAMANAAKKKEALRYNDGKPELHYLVSFPSAAEALASVCKYGEGKYSAYNYLKGAPLSQYLSSGLRHLFAFWRGEDRDPESGCSHLGHFLWNTVMLVEMWHSRSDLDDRPHVVLSREKPE